MGAAVSSARIWLRREQPSWFEPLAGELDKIWIDPTDGSLTVHGEADRVAWFERVALAIDELVAS